MIRTLLRYAARRWVLLAALGSIAGAFAGKKTAQVVRARREPEDVFGSVEPLTTERPRKPRPAGSGRLGTDQVASAVKGAKSAEEQLATALRQQGIAALVALENSGQLPVVVVRDAQLHESLRGAPDTVTQVTETIANLSSSSWRVVQAFGVPGTGEWSALVRIGDQSVIVRVVDSGQFRSTTTEAQERTTARRSRSTGKDDGFGIEQNLHRPRYQNTQV